VILDDETIELKLSAAGKTILDAVNKEGYDAPYSCRGGVCCTCRAKVLKGKVTMSLNYSLTDKEVADGYILTCQAHPASEEVTISYDV
jgi:ring-1,2-phenylacetyl-CoA epoxidase subunit PaaE